MRRLMVPWLLVALLAACSDSPVDPDAIPTWLTELIKELESQPVANPPAYIARYTYRDQFCYYLPPRCCDIPSVLFDSEGTIICLPDGGFTGGGDGRCPDFFAERREEKIVWRDPRAAP